MIRVVIASGYPVVRAGLARLLETQDDFAVVGEARDAAEATTMAADLHPEVVLLDIVLTPDRLSVIRDLAAVPLNVIVLADPTPDLVRQMLSAGVRGYLLKETSGDELIAAIQAAQQGMVVLHPAVARLALQAGLTSSAPSTSPRDPLSPRELEVLALVAQGLANKTIAQRLHLSEHTVKFHVASIIAKLDAASRTEAVSLAARQGLITL